MDDMTPFEDRFEARLRAFARTGVQSADSAAVARAVADGHPRSAATRPARGRRLDEIHRTRQRAAFSRWRTHSRFKTALLAAASIAVVVSGAALLLSRPGQPVIGAPSMAPGASQPAVVGPSVMATATPSPTPTPILWTEASLDEDWPAPVRPEPGGRAVVRTLGPVGGRSEYADPLDDAGSSIPWADIRSLDVDLGAGYAWHVGFGLASPPPLGSPTERWIAYGVVVDTDRDGVPDLRFGVDNIPATAPGKDEHRAWITDLHTGRTESAVGAPYGSVGETYLDTVYPPGFHFGGDTTGPPEVDALSGLRAPFYAWASTIEDGRVVATDYAPDVGWLDPSAAANR